MLTAWRIAKRRYASAAFDGEGARLYGGRWSSAGTRVAYAAQSVALATVEVLAGLGKMSLLPSYSLVSVRFDESEMEVLPLSSLPANWRTYPAPPELQAIGDTWIAENRSLVLQVPSAIIETEANYLLNPMHASFASVTISAALPFEIDARLVATIRKP
jgi:RES domain-containing protein